MPRKHVTIFFKDGTKFDSNNVLWSNIGHSNVAVTFMGYGEMNVCYPLSEIRAISEITVL